MSWYDSPPKGECLNEAATFTSGPSLVLLAEEAAIKVGKSNCENVKQQWSTKWWIANLQYPKFIKINQNSTFFSARAMSAGLPSGSGIRVIDHLASLGSWKTYTVFNFSNSDLILFVYWIQMLPKALNLKWYLTNIDKHVFRQGLLWSQTHVKPIFTDNI